MKKEDLLLTAYHEAGHALVSLIVLPEETISKISIIQMCIRDRYLLFHDVYFLGKDLIFVHVLSNQEVIPPHAYQNGQVLIKQNLKCLTYW